MLAILFIVAILFIANVAISCQRVEDCLKFAEKKNLHKHKTWLYLLHYENSESHIDHDYFFLSKKGKFDPLEEMKTTIYMFLEDESIKCRYPARIFFLSKELGIKVNYDNCNNLNQFLDYFKGDEVFLVYANQYPRSLSSLFGHLFLKVGSEKYGYYMISYTADTSIGKGIFYPFKSILGYYRGYFYVVPYEEGTQDYIRFQGRELYKFRVNLSREEVKLLKMHIWELLHIRPSYYFLQGNCASSINDIVLVSENKKHSFPPWIIPTDVVTNLYERDVIEDQDETKLFHKSQKVSLSYSVFEDRINFSYRPIYHDLLDKPRGFRRGYELIGFGINLGYSRSKHETFLNKWRIFKMSYLSDFREGISWVLDMGIKRQKEQKHVYAFYTEGGLGFSLYAGKITLFAMPYIKYISPDMAISAFSGILLQDRYISFMTSFTFGRYTANNNEYGYFKSGIDIHPHYRYSLRLEHEEEVNGSERRRETTVGVSLFF